MKIEMDGRIADIDCLDLCYNRECQAVFHDILVDKIQCIQCLRMVPADDIEDCWCTDCWDTEE